MNIDSLWKTIIKLFGIWFLIDCLSTIPQFNQNLFYANGIFDLGAFIYTLLFLIVNLLLYILILRLLIFKSDWIIKKLKLNQNYTETKIDLNTKSSTIITISIIIIGGITLIDSIPRLFSELFEFVQQKMLMKDYPKFNLIILELLKSILGYLLITKSKKITKYIEKESTEN
jgi:hypothetical protein